MPPKLAQTRLYSAGERDGNGTHPAIRRRHQNENLDKNSKFAVILRKTHLTLKSIKRDMIMKKQPAFFLSQLLVFAFAVHALYAQNQAPKTSPAQSSPEPALPYTPSLDSSAMDRSVDPCVDFYRYACGSWSKKNPMPADRSVWVVYAKAYEDNLQFLHGILEQAKSTSQSDPITQKIGNFYAACMNEDAVNKAGLQPLQPELQAIAAIQSPADLAAETARLQLMIAGNSIIFGAGSTQDPDDTEKQIAQLDQGGIGLPDRDYYTNQDEKSKEQRAEYVEHVQKVFELMGNSPVVAAKNAATIMKMETGFAQASWTQVERRDPYKLKNKMKLADLNTLAPNFDWKTFFQDLHAPQFAIVNVSAPAFFKEMNKQLTEEPLQNWKTYLSFELVNSYSPYLSDPFVQENFDFYSKYLGGAQQLPARWKRCVENVDNNLGEALGQVYVQRVFSPELKQDTLDMVEHIEKAMEQRINELDWMSPATKQQALLKLHNIRNKIGYPDKWRDYSSVVITPDDFAGNMRNAIIFESRRELNKIGQPVDHGEWDMTPTTVDAYFNPQMNDINFPAAVLQPPLFDAKLDDAPNYGNTGGTIGHELTHAFDDEGRQFDLHGNLKDWWTANDAKRFSERAKCVEDQYSSYIAVDDLHVNGKLTLGENIADLGGEILAYMAWKDATKGKQLTDMDGLTPDQRFFVGFAQWACGEIRPERLREQTLTDPHSPPVYRVNGVVVNMPEFQKAFSCKVGQPMVKPADKVCRIW
jgi:putative endopeptidase